MYMNNRAGVEFEVFDKLPKEHRDLLNHYADMIELLVYSHYFSNELKSINYYKRIVRGYEPI